MRTWKCITPYLLVTAFLPPLAQAQSPAPAPLALCTNSTDAATQSSTFYRFRFNEPGGASPTNMDVVRVDLAGNASNTQETVLYNTIYTTVAAGTAADGTVYAMEAPGNTPRSGSSNLNLLRYDATGATVLGKVTGLPGLSSSIPEMGAPANAADIDRSTGDLIIGTLRTGGAMNRLYRVNVTSLVATPINLSTAIPGNSSGDFALDPSGGTAYGLSFSSSGSTTGTTYFWKADLSTGAVTTIKTFNLLSNPPYYFPVGGAAWLANGNIAFTANNASLGGQTANAAGSTIVLDVSGNQVSRYSSVNSSSTDSVRCVPQTRITKSVLDPTGLPAANPPTGPYPFTVSCASNNFSATGSISLTAGQNTGFADLLIPENLQGCTVAENTAALPNLAPSQMWAAPGYQQLPATIPQAGPITAQIANRILNQPGQLTISKQVNTPAGTSPYTGSIPFTVACTNPDYSVSGAISVSNNQGVAAPISVAAGSVCTVSETLPAAPTDYAWASPVYTQPQTPMSAGGSQTALIVNMLTSTRPAEGYITVSKSVSTPVDTAPYNGAIAFNLACSNPSYSYNGIITVTNNQGVTAPIGVPVGSSCMVTETLPAAPDGYSWNVPVYVQPADTIAAGVNQTAVITNTLQSGDVAGLKKIPANSPWALALLSLFILVPFGVSRWRHGRDV